MFDDEDFDEDDVNEDDVDEWARAWGVAPAPPVHLRHVFVHECPACHAIHEDHDERALWCPEHGDMRELWERRKRPAEDPCARQEWECAGCAECGVVA